MGIRKHFEKKGERDLKLQDLSLDDERSESGFDIDKRLTEKDWKGFRSELSECVERGRWFGFARLAGDLVVLDRDRIADFLEKIGDEELKKMKETYLSFDWDVGMDMRTSDRVYFKYMVLLKRLFPDKDLGDLIPWKDVESVWKRGRDLLEGFSRTDNYDPFEILVIARDLRILFPERFPIPDLVLDKQKLKDYLDSEKSRGMEHYANRLASLRIAFPEVYKEVNLIPADCRTMLARLDEQDRYFGFVDMAVNLKIIEADEVKITDKGLELIKKKEDFRAEKKKRPVRRSF